MRRLSIAKSLFRSLFRRRQVNAELGDEIRSPIELLADQKVPEEMLPDEARRSAVAIGEGPVPDREDSGLWALSHFVFKRRALRGQSVYREPGPDIAEVYGEKPTQLGVIRKEDDRMATGRTRSHKHFRLNPTKIRRAQCPVTPFIAEFQRIQKRGTFRLGFRRSR